ncbi:unnamed protein product [Caenorhabditis auriculariae]|uniref:Uncharacterized protein n=1 Tax=Caenorhabditis auriculariae TaxID=2777116 RepID=A0A8S1H7A3_9PELO|nr:unnamed protein product [Caenorhabditis auriculariae]
MLSEDSDDYIVRFNVVSIIDGFYEAYSYHQSYIPLTQCWASVGAIIVVFLATLTLSIVLKNSSRMIKAFQVFLALQIIVSCALSVYLAFCGLYGVLPYPILFNRLTSASHYRITGASLLFLLYLLMLEVAFCTFTMTRNALTASQITIFGLTHSQVMMITERVVWLVAASIILFSLYPIINCLEWDQDEAHNIAASVDVRSSSLVPPRFASSLAVASDNAQDYILIATSDVSCACGKKMKLRRVREVVSPRLEATARLEAKRGGTSDDDLSSRLLLYS